MKIDRNNYQVWLIDWIDGKLNSAREADVIAFLDANPDIKAEAEELNSVIAAPSTMNFPTKKSLFRSPSELTDEQFEMLSVAMLEKDISTEQQAELNEILINDTGRRHIHNLIQKTKLSHGDIRYSGKKKLLQPGDESVRLRIFTRVLAVAATLALLFSLYLLIPGEKSEPENISFTGNAPSVTTNPGDPVKSSEKQPAETEQIAMLAVKDIKSKDDPDQAPDTKIVTNVTIPVEVSPEETETMLPIRSEASGADPVTVPVIQPVTVRNTVELAASLPEGSLVASRIELQDPETEDERSALGRFIAKNFRQKVLNEEMTDDNPLKAYEIAEAGVSGINKIFGWEMALSRNVSESGDVRSVNFSSRLIKFNAPVRKSEPNP